MDRCSDPRGHAIAGPGDLSVCLKCGAVMQFDENMKLGGIEQERIDQLKSDPRFMANLVEVVQAVHFVQKLHAQRN